MCIFILSYLHFMSSIFILIFFQYIHLFIDFYYIKYEDEFSLIKYYDNYYQCAKKCFVPNTYSKGSCSHIEGKKLNINYKFGFKYQDLVSQT